MTQLSFCWSCTNTGDGGPTSFSVEIVEAFLRFGGNFNQLDAGVIYWMDNTVFPGFTNPIGGTPATNYLLTPSNPVGNTVRIKPGAGMVEGWFYISDADIDTDVSGGNANATDIIGLRRDIAAQTVRLFHGRGAAASTYSLVQTSATWEIPLVEVLLDGSGNYSSHTDVREFVRSALFPPQRTKVFVPAMIGTNLGSLATINWSGGQFSPFSASFDGGIALTSAADIGAVGFWIVPEDIIGNDWDFKAVISPDGGAGHAAGNIVINYEYTGSQARQPAFASGGSTVNVNTYPVSTFASYGSIFGSTITTFTRGTPVQLMFWRDGNNGADTFPNSIYLQGFQVEYNRHYAPDYSQSYTLG